MRRLFALIVSVVAALVLALPASASGAGAVSFTQTFTPKHPGLQVIAPPDPMAVNPCSGAPGTITITYLGVFHITVLTSGVGAGTGWATFTGTGSFSLVPVDPSQPSFTGKFTAWDGDNFNLTNFTSTSILVVNGTGSDGSTLRFHDVAHITVLNPTSPNPTVVVAFDKPSCG